MLRILSACVLASCACASAVKAVGAPSPAEMAELWIDPGQAARDLFDGPRGTVREPLRPQADTRYEILKRDTSGFSITYQVRDAGGREWSVKIGPEARTEVVTSRIVWALGYHQLPSYFVERWIGVEDAKGQQFGGARFRPHDDGMKSLGQWEWQKNPFVGTRPYHGLLVSMMILNSTDLKDPNNELFAIEGEPREGSQRWYVVKDLGASLGATGRFDPPRGNIEAFEREPFIVGASRGRVRFGFRGRHQELLQSITTDDVRWTCERLQKLTDGQLHDAFRAGGFTDDVTARFIARIRQKIDEGLRLR